MSQQKLVHRPTRTSLSNANVEAEVFIRMNLPKFREQKQNLKFSRMTAEMTSESESDRMSKKQKV